MRRVRIVLLGVAVLILGAGGSGTRSADGAARGGVLRLGGDWTEVESVDPAIAYNIASWELLQATCARLFDYPDRPGAAGAQVVPEVARRFTVSEDGRTYTFDLKRTFRFSTGKPVNARSFAAAFNRDADPRVKANAGVYLREIVGAGAVLGGKADTISGVQVLAPYRLRIRLTRPLADFTARLTMPTFCPIPPGTPRREVDDLPGSGPYYIDDYVRNRRLVLRRNPYYRGDRPAHVDRVEWTVGLDEEQCIEAAEHDRIDFCSTVGVSASTHRRLAQAYGINRGRYFVGPHLGTWFFYFNHDRPAFKGIGQIPLAKAINHAIDRPALARPFGYLAGKRSDRMLPPAIGRAEHDYPIAGADPVTARKWLAKARLKPSRLVLWTFSYPIGVEVAQVFAYDLKQIGIDVEIKYYGIPEVWVRPRTRGEPYDVLIGGWSADYADPAAFFRPLLDGRTLPAAGRTAPGNNNLGYVDEPDVNAAIDAADRLSGAARRKAFADLDAKLMRGNPPWAPFLHTNTRAFVSASLGCFFVHPVYGLDIAAVCKK